MSPDQTLQDDPKRARILDGAMTVFLAYGFQRTTMDDIARAAEISRPALYLLFRNKTDIYRALATGFMQQCLAQARSAFAADEPLTERLEKAVTCIFDLMVEIEESPHGAEILDMKTSLAADIVACGRGAMVEMIERAIDAEARTIGIDLAGRDLSSRLLADMLLDAIDGLKMRGPDREELRRTTRRYIGVVVNALNA